MKQIRLLALLLSFSLALSGLSAAGTFRAVRAEEELPADSLSIFRQIVYSRENGLPCGEANDIAQTPDGSIWIGTYAGLYRFDGQGFQWINCFNSVRSINALYVDLEGRLWIGTNDNGLSVLEGDQIVRTMEPSDGLLSYSVQDVICSSDGYCYMSTSSGLQFFPLSRDMAPVCTIPDISYPRSLSAGSNGLVAVVTGFGELYFLREGQVLSCQQPADGQSEFTGCFFDQDGCLLAGTVRSGIHTFDVSSGEPEETGAPLPADGLYSIRDMKRLQTGELLIAADNGIGLIDADGQFVKIDTGNFNNSIDRILQDDQGSLWFVSSRLGLLRMVHPAAAGIPDEIPAGNISTVPDFRNIYTGAGMPGKVVNTIVRWNGVYYVGTDNGLDAVDPGSMQQVTDELTEQLSSCRIRSLMVDKNNRLWIAVYNKGVLRVEPDGGQYMYQAPESLPEKRPRTISELSDGTVVIGGNSGLCFIRHDQVTDTIRDYVILSVTEMKDGRILAATDGSGVLIMENNRIDRTLTREDGLTSDVVLRSVPDEKTGGVFLVASNGLCYMTPDEEIRELRTFPYFNNYDLWIRDSSTLFVMSSAGVFVVDRDELLSGGDEIHYQLLDYRQGLDYPLVSNSWQYYDETSGLLLLAGSAGIYALNPGLYTAETQIFSVSPDAGSRGR